MAGHRPALVISPKAYNQKVGLALFCPLTTRVKGYPFEVRLPAKSKAEGAILSDQLKSMDWRARKAKRFARATDAVMREVLGKIEALLFGE